MEWCVRLGGYAPEYVLHEDTTHEQMSRALRFAFLEIARFNKTQEECNSFEDKFLYMMKNLPTFAEKPELWDDPYFEDMVQEAEFANMSFAEQEAYIQAMKNRWDYQNTIAFAREKGLEEGMEKGMEKGMERGMEQGLQQGKEQMARNLKELGVDIAAIAQSSGLTEEQVQAL